MSAIVYHDFDLKIESRRADGSYRVIVLQSPEGEGEDYMHLLKPIAELRGLVEEAEEEVRGIKRVERDPSAAEAQGPTERLGSILFNSLFSGRVRDLYLSSLARIAGAPDAGLRIKLHINPEDPTLAELAGLPWELLYREERHDFLSLSPVTPIVRYLDVPRPTRPLPLQLPLRVLVCMSSPTDKRPLNLERERALIERNLGERKDINLEFLEHPTPEQLQDKLAATRFHILHYMGHGGFIKGKGVLLLENEYGKSRQLSGEDLAILLGENTLVRLVFLNACETGGVATALVRKGLLAVIAMQFPVTDSAAIAFAKRVYPLLARDYHIDAAVVEGRKAIRIAEPGSMEWATPVLFMRTPEGALFEVTREATPWEKPPPKRPVNVSKLYWQGVARTHEGKWRAAMECFQRVAEAAPDYKEVQKHLAEATRHVEYEEQLAELYETA